MLPLLLLASVAAFAADPAIGRWKMDLSRTTYNPGPAPKGISSSYADAGERGTRFEATVEQASGRKFTMSWTARYDGKEYPVSGSPLYDTITYKRIDSRTVEFTLKKGGKVVSHGKRVVAQDGLSYTNYAEGVDESGKSFKNVALYVKQP